MNVARTIWAAQWILRIIAAGFFSWQLFGLVDQQGFQVNVGAVALGMLCVCLAQAPTLRKLEHEPRGAYSVAGWLIGSMTALAIAARALL